MASKSEFAASLLSISGFGAALRRCRSWRGVVTLIYHRIGDRSGSADDHGLFSATAEDFDDQIASLKKWFDVIGPPDLPNARRQRGGRFALITFDDGYRDNFQLAFPILQQNRLAATFFLTTGLLDQDRAAWWDQISRLVRLSNREKINLTPWMSRPIDLLESGRQSSVCDLLNVYRYLPSDQTEPFLNALAEAVDVPRDKALNAGQCWMTWDMVRQMHAAGMWIGGHTVTHPILSRLDLPEQRREISRCAARLRDELGEPMRWFSYPNGKPDSFNEQTRACLRAEGVEVAFSNYGGWRRFDDWDAYDVRRAPVESDYSPARFAAAVTLPGTFAR